MNYADDDDDGIINFVLKRKNVSCVVQLLLFSRHLFVLASGWLRVFKLKGSFFLLESCLFSVRVCMNAEEGLS